jgi:hypothetical protein
MTKAHGKNFWHKSCGNFFFAKIRGKNLWQNSVAKSRGKFLWQNSKFWRENLKIFKLENLKICKLLIFFFFL